jgi:hypothetical protein
MTAGWTMRSSTAGSNEIFLLYLKRPDQTCCGALTAAYLKDNWTSSLDIPFISI